MAGHTAADGEDTFGDVHAFDVLRRGFQAHQDYLLAFRYPFLGSFGVKDYLTAGSTGRSRQSSSQDLGTLELGGIELIVEEGIQLRGVNQQDSLFLSNKAFVYQIAGDLHSGLSGTLTIAGSGA